MPFPESSLNEEAGKQFMEDYEGFFYTAKLYTELHAKATVEQRELYFKRFNIEYKIRPDQPVPQNQQE